MTRRTCRTRPTRRPAGCGLFLTSEHAAGRCSTALICVPTAWCRPWCCRTGVALGLALMQYGREEAAEALIEQMTRDADPIIRYGGMYVIGMAYR